MGGAKRYPSTAVHGVDGFRKGLNPSYVLIQLNAIIDIGFKLSFKYRGSGAVGPDQAKIGVPSAFRYLPQGNRYPGMDLFGVKARRQRGIGEIDSLRFLTDEQNSRHVVLSILPGRRNVRSLSSGAH